MNIMTIDKTALQRHAKLMRESPKQFAYAAAGVMNTMAFQTRTNDIKNLSSTMIIRDPRFLTNSLRVDKAKGNRSIALMEAHVYSVKRDRFTGWEEQETGKQKQRKRAGTLAARGGNKSAKMKNTARFKSANKFYRPSQFHAKTEKSQFMAMIRVMATRGGGEFLLDNNIATKRGHLNKGLYSFKKNRITRLQKLEGIGKTKHTGWRTHSINQLNSIDFGKVWSDNVDHVLSNWK